MGSIKIKSQDPCLELPPINIRQPLLRGRPQEPVQLTHTERKTSGVYIGVGACLAFGGALFSFLASRIADDTNNHLVIGSVVGSVVVTVIGAGLLVYQVALQSPSIELV